MRDPGSDHRCDRSLLLGGTLKELREEGEIRNWPVVAEVKWIQRCLFEDWSDPLPINVTNNVLFRPRLCIYQKPIGTISRRPIIHKTQISRLVK